MFSRIRDWLQKRKSVEPPSADRTSQEQINNTVNERGAPVYSSDQPIMRRDQDRFNRWPFAKRIAETIANGRDQSSIIVGIYGPWGDGKTSTLALMETALTELPYVIPIRFNSWQFGSEEQLLRAFFDTLADALGKSLTSRKEEIGNILKKYGSILSIASLDLAHMVKLDPGKGLAALGEALSSVELDTLRGRLEAILMESGKRAVILVDDIDRLDRAEIHAIFRLIKVSASFKHTSYVLAFDDEMVAAALGERYGGGGAAAGRNFLEKIIHVPLHLPPAETIELRKMALEGIDAALSQQEISLSREDIERFTRSFIDAIESQMTTPRQAKRFSNAISFALPLLKGEANSVDVMLVEAMRIFFPRLYATIRDNPSLFLGSAHDRGDTNKRQTQLHNLVGPALDDVGVADKDVVYRRLIETLFPRSGRTGYGDDWDSVWINEQRICSPEYFGRYFSYSVPPGDIGDIEVQQFVNGMCDGSISDDQVGNLLGRFAERRAVPRLLDKLRYQEETIDPSGARRMALAIVPFGSLFPKEEGPFVFRTTSMQGAILIRNLLLRLPLIEREAVAVAIIRKAEQLPFAAECFRWMQYSKEEAESERVLAQQSELTVGHALADRIRDAAGNKPLYASFGNDSPQLLWMWMKYGLAGEMQASLQTRLRESEDAVDQFLAVFVGRGWGLESGVSSRSDFDRNSYDRVTDLIAPDFIVECLHAKYGDNLVDDREREPKTQGQWERQTAGRFVAIHGFVLTEKQNPSGAPGPEPELDG